MTNPAAETKSIGLLAFAQLSWFLKRGLDCFIMTGQILLVYRDFAKTHANPDTDSNYPYVPGRYHSFTGYYEIDAYTLTQSILDNLT